MTIRRMTFLAALCAASAATVPASAQKSKSPSPGLSPPATTDTAGEEINVSVGETYTLSARGIRNWSEAVPGVVEVKLTADGAQFLLSGHRPGSTTLLLIRDNGSQQMYTINVFARAPGSVERELQQMLDGFPTLRVRRIGAHHVIEGAVQDEKEKARIDHIASLYPGQVDSLVYVGATTVPDGDAAVVSQKHVLVRIDFYFVEMDASSGYAVGLGWPKSIGGAGVLQATGTFDLLAGKVTQGAVTVNQPLPQLDLAQSKGWGKVLKHATVVTNSGEAAKFRSGGTQNFSVNTGLTVGIQTIPYGVEVSVVPRFDPARRDIALKIASDVSDLTPAGTGTNIPSTTVSKLETVVNVRLGQSIVLSGVRISSRTHSVDGLPLLSRIPVLGLLFGSHQDLSTEREGAIYIVPSVVETVSSSSLDLIDGAVRTFKDFSGNVEKVHLFESRPPKTP